MSYPAPTYAPSSLSLAVAPALAPRGRGAAIGAPYSSPAASPAALQAARYRDAELLAASPGQLVVMLFDKLIVTVRRARVACEARRIEERCEAIVKASEMVTELRLSLDHAQGGVLSAQLDALYVFMSRELLEANRRQDATKLDAVLHVAAELRSAFAQVVAGAAASAASASPIARSA